MSRTAIVGLFAIIGLAGLVLAFFELTDISTKAKGYRTAVHFRSAAGLRTGSVVLESGVGVGTVDAIQLLDDYTVDVIMAIKGSVDIPKNSKFLIQAPLTGDPNLIIIPPTPPRRPPGSAIETPAPNAVATLPHHVLDLPEQPEGEDPVSVGDLLVQGQGELAQFDKLLKDFASREPKLLNSLQSSLNNANELTTNLNTSFAKISSKALALEDQFGTTMTAASRNVIDLTSTLDKTVSANAGTITSIAQSLNRTAQSIEISSRSLKDLAQNQDVKNNLVSTTKSIAAAAQTISELTVDLRQVTGNPQTQAQLRDAAANADAAVQRVNSLLGSFGGTSNVYGVDPGATPAPVPSGADAPVPARPPGRSSVPVNSTVAQGGAAGGSGRAPATGLPGNFKNKIGALARNLVSVQLRVSELNAQRPFKGTGSPLLGFDRGPQSDVNLIMLPRGPTSALVGANDIGANASYNFAALQTLGGGFRIGGGILYSRLGLLGSYSGSIAGIDARIYDLRHPTLDGYGHLNVRPGMSLFAGQRDILHDSRRNVFGLQLQF